MATMKDVAQRANVSPATVSHVLNGTRFVQPETLGRVQRAVEDLNYEMDGIARSLRVRATSTLALLIPDLANPFFPELATAVQQEAARAGYDVVVYSVDVPDGDPRILFEHYLRAIRGKRYDAVVFAETTPMEATARERLVDTGVPVILIGGTPHSGADRVYIDDYQAARDLMAYLIGKGHTAIAHITGAPGMASTRDRQRGYLDSLRAAGLPAPPELEAPGAFTRDGGYATMRHLLALPRRPSAVFAANDMTALGAIAACLDAGVRVPDDIAVAGFDDLSLAAYVRPTLTTVYHGQREIGREAVRLAVARLRGACPDDRQTIIIPHRLVSRDSA